MKRIGVVLTVLGTVLICLGWGEIYASCHPPSQPAKQTDPLCGNWTSQVDISEWANERYFSDSQYADFANVRNAVLDVELHIGSDGTYDLFSKQESVAQINEALENAAVQGVPAYYEDFLGVPSSELGLALNSLRIRLSEKTAEALEGVVYEGFSESGSYVEKDRQFFLLPAGETEVHTDTPYFSYFLAGDELYFQWAYLNRTIPGKSFPVVFHRK